MGQVDRIVRFTLAMIIAALYFAHVITGTIALVLIVVAVILIITSFIGFCPLYFPFGIRTKKK